MYKQLPKEFKDAEIAVEKISRMCGVSSHEQIALLFQSYEKNERRKMLQALATKKGYNKAVISLKEIMEHLKIPPKDNALKKVTDSILWIMFASNAALIFMALTEILLK